MPEIHAGIQSLLTATFIVLGVAGLFLQAVSFVIAAILQVGE